MKLNRSYFLASFTILVHRVVEGSNETFELLQQRQLKGRKIKQAAAHNHVLQAVPLNDDYIGGNLVVLNENGTFYLREMLVPVRLWMPQGLSMESPSSRVVCDIAFTCLMIRLVPKNVYCLKRL